MIPARRGGHLQDAAADLVAGRLSPMEAEKARTHLAGCADCAELVRQEGLVRDRLRRAAGPAPDGALLAGLISIAPASPPISNLPGGTAPDASRWVFAATLLGGASLLAMGTATQLAQSERPTSQRPVTVAAVSTAERAGSGSVQLVPMPQALIRATAAIWPCVGQNRDSTTP